MTALDRLGRLARLERFPTQGPERPRPQPVPDPEEPALREPPPEEEEES